jgi:hypothetical protein
MTSERYQPLLQDFFLGEDTADQLRSADGQSIPSGSLA